MWILCCLWLLGGCTEDRLASNLPPSSSAMTKADLKPNAQATGKLEHKVDHVLPKEITYPWFGDAYHPNSALVQQILTPAAYQREALDKGSFGEWLRYLPLAAAEQKVMLYNGKPKPYQAGAYRVVDIDIGKGDLQQCADAIMRLKAEYHYSKGEYDAIHFNYTSGDRVAFDDWRRGRKPVVKGNRVAFTALGASADNSYANFRKYLRSIFTYAGTASLARELKRQKLKDLKVGDLFIQGGFPGHAVLVVDVAAHKQTGKKIFLLAQSYMPAQSIHILRNFEHQNELSPWYPEDFGAVLQTPEWDFEASMLCKF